MLVMTAVSMLELFNSI